MRIGGSLPFNASGAWAVSLSGGQYYYMPPGNYLVTLGSQSVIQWWDPVMSTWRNISPAAAPGFAISVDGYNYRITNLSGVVQGASITNAGSGGTNGIGPTQTGSTLSFGAAPTNGQAAKGYVIVGGALSSPTITNAGSGFTAPPLILIDPPPQGGVQATATCNLTSGGAINAVTLNNAGAGYTAVPNYYVVPQFLDYPGQLALPYTVPGSPSPVVVANPPGTFQNLPPGSWNYGLTPTFPLTGGALITSGALTGSGTLTGIVVTDYGSGYTSVPTITLGGTSLGAAAATALMSWAVTALTGSGGVAYTVGNPVISTLGYFSTTSQVVNNDFLLAREFHGRLTSTAGAVAIEDPGFGFQTALAAGNFGVAIGGSIPTTTVTFSAITMGGVTDTSLLQQMINE